MAIFEMFVSRNFQRGMKSPDDFLAYFEVEGSERLWKKIPTGEKPAVVKVLVCHGEPDGTFPGASAQAVEHFNPHIIYCCHPKTVRTITGDLRVQGNHDRQVMIDMMRRSSGTCVVTIEAID